MSRAATPGESAKLKLKVLPSEQIRQCCSFGSSVSPEKVISFSGRTCSAAVGNLLIPLLPFWEQALLHAQEGLVGLSSGVALRVHPRGFFSLPSLQISPHPSFFLRRDLLTVHVL